MERWQDPEPIRRRKARAQVPCALTAASAGDACGRSAWPGLCGAGRDGVLAGQVGQVGVMTSSTAPRQRLTLAVACSAQVMMVLDVMIVSVALPSLQHELHLSPAGLEWVVSAYALALAALIPTGGALGDHFGRKRLFISGVTLFTLASAGCALSVSGGMLIGFRIIQGVGGAVMSSLTLSLIAEAYPPETRTGPIGLWAAVSGLAVAGGSVAGGLLLSVFPWSSIFWVNVPIGIATVVISQVVVAESREPAPRPFDTGGVTLSACGLLLLTFGFVESSDVGWHPPAVPACIAAGAAIIAVFFVWEHRAASPMIPPELLRTPSFGWACAVYLLAYLAFSGFIYYVTLFFQNIDQWSALRTGLSWLFFCIPYFVVAQSGKWVERRLPAAAAIGLGCLIAALGMLGMSQLKQATPFAWPAACYVLVGVGFALMVPAGSSAAMAKVPAGSSGIGSGLFNACRQIGTATGLAILGSIGASVTLASWHHLAGAFPAAGQRRAAQVGTEVAGGQVHAVAEHLGAPAHDPAVISFLQGFEVALLVAGGVIAAAGMVGFMGLRHLRGPGSRHRQLAEARMSR
jgi:MFS transporter, DHA2 family, methylenomycin A resistance protein